MNYNIEDIYSLSPMQQGMLFHSLLDSKKNAYIEQLSCEIKGEFNIDAFQEAWNIVASRHPILRSAFIWEDVERPLQVVIKEVEIPFEVLSWCDLDETAFGERYREYLYEDIQKGFDLSSAPLMRITVIVRSSNTFNFVWSHHHILFDGWGMQIVIKEVFEVYESIVKNIEPKLRFVRPYKDYISWLEEHDLTQAENFWRKRLSGFYSPTLIGGSEKRTDESQKQAYKTRKFSLSEELTESLNNISKRYQVTLNTIIQGAWAILLHFYSGEDDVVFGATVSGRPMDLPGAENIVGLFINTLPVRAAFDHNMNMVDWLKKLQLENAESLQHDYTPLYELQKWSCIPKGSPLFDNIIVFENYPIDKSLKEKNTVVEISNVQSYSETNYNITFVVYPGKQLSFEIAYDENVNSSERIDLIFNHLNSLLKQFAENPRRLILNTDILSAKEKIRIISEYNQTEVSLPEELCIHTWFEKCAKENPHQIALNYNGYTLTYSGLNQKADKLADHLIEIGAGPEVIIGISVERSFEMIIGILGILKSGAAYLPLDPFYPEDRLNYMLKDSGANILLTKKKYIGLFPEDIKRVILDEELASAKNEAAEKYHKKALPQNLAYVIYTSGSTGRPKGTMLQHKGFCNFIKRMIDDFSIDKNSRVLQFASFSFDASVAEIFLGLLSGATLYLTDREKVISTDDLSEILRKEKITAATLPPAVLSVLENKDLPDFRSIISIGETCKWDIVEKWGRDHKLFNGYGPTETTVGAAWLNVYPNQYSTVTAPVGRAIGNARIYILNKNLNPVPQGTTGEIYIGGMGVARGYLNRPMLTAEKFIPDPFSIIPGARIYMTGDLGCYLPDGTIEFKGRIDNQVKLRGFRIELEEIESALKSISEIKDCVVIDRTDEYGNKKLVAYLIFSEGKTVDQPEIKNKLSGKLPDFMVPSAFVQMNSFPVTPNGKLDKKALPAPELSEENNENSQTLNETEELLANIWKNILKVKAVSKKDNFFELGGHSLSATQMLSRIRDIFKIDLPLEKIFSSRDLEELALEIRSYMNNNEKIFSEIKTVSRHEDLRLSFSQQRLWFIEKLRPGGSSYNIPAAIKITGTFSIDAMKSALNEIVGRHEVLRTSFKEKGGKPYLNIQEKLSFETEVTDLSLLNDEEKERKAYEIIENASGISFNLSKAPLFDFSVIRLSEEEHIFISVMHHIISDGWSTGIFFNELKMLYEKYLIGDTSFMLPELSVQYADYAQWQQNLMSAELFKKELDYWKDQLSDIPQMLQISTDKARPSVQTINGSSAHIIIDGILKQKLQKLSIERGATAFMVMLAAFKFMLHKYSGQDDIVVGTPIAGRIDTKLEDLIGFFVNNLTIRSRFGQIKTFNDLIDQVRNVTLEAYKYQHIPFERLVEELQPERDLSHSPIFQVMFVFQNLPIEFKRSAAIRLETVPVMNRTSNFDISMIIADAENGYNVEIEYNTDLFIGSTIERMLSHYRRILEIIAANSEEYISDIDILDQTEKVKLVKEWNNTAAAYPDNICAHELFEELAQIQPDQNAVRFKKDVSCPAIELSYGELNKRANKLANYLCRIGIKQESFVGILTERSVEMIVAILGVLKAGCAFVPVDPANPKDRINYIIKDAGISLLIINGNASAAEYEDAKVLNIDSEWKEISKESDICLSRVNKDNLAYVIYTSGSTGKPKGTMLRHQGLCSLASAQKNIFMLDKDSRVLQFSSLSFDASVWEIVMALLSGATLCLTSKEVITSGDSLAEIMESEEISIVTLPPSVLAVLPQKPLGNLKTIVTAGEAVSKELVNKWSQGRRFFNAYGPTETTVCASIYLCEDDCLKDPPIGKALSNFKLYVLDQYGQLCGIGIPGELCVEGAGLARGYLNRPDLTAEKFIPNPFSENRGSRLYRTGDLVKYNAEGNIEYLGRIDHQVKIRGFRIELGEIEAALHQYEKIKDVVVTAREDSANRKIIAAYYVEHENQEITNGQLKTYLKNILPEYMIPSAFIKLEKMPLNISGKIDLKALPKPESSRKAMGVEYAAPVTETEEKLVNIVADLMNIKNVGILDNFFDLGGHSLLATQLTSRIREELHVEIPLKTLFEKPVVTDLAKEIDAIKQEKYRNSKIERVIRDEVLAEQIYPLSYAQRRMWFLDQFEPGSPYYNIPMAYKIHGEFNIDVFSRVIDALVKRHESLRTTFREINGKPHQVISKGSGISVEVIRVAGENREAIENEVQRLAKEEARKPFDLTTGPLMRVSVLNISSEENVVLLTMHHVISDGWSMGILIKEISTLYRAFISSEEDNLPEMEYQYIDYSKWQQEYLEGEVLQSQLDYWRKQLEDKPPLLELPTDKSRPAVWTNEGATMSVVLSKTLTESIKKLCKEENATLFMVLISALNVLLSKYCNDDDISIGTPIANRTRREFEDIIGLFINTLVLRTSLKGNPSFNELLNRVREVTINSYDNQDLPFELLVEQLQPDRNMSYPPLFQIMFILQNSPSVVEIVNGITMESIDVDMGTSTTDITISVAESSEGLDVSVEYNTDLFFSSTIERLLNHYKNILESVTLDPMQKISDIMLFDKNEYDKIVYDWNRIISARPENAMIHQLFEKQVLLSKDNIAVVFNEQKLTYEELNLKANKLAHKLISLSVKPEQAVAICIDRSLDMMVAALAVLKSGGAYLPLDSSYPEDRLEYMLLDAGVNVLITQESLLGIIPSFKGTIVLIDSDREIIKSEISDHPDHPINPENPAPENPALDEKNMAYLIYTSGSTGRPKGTMVPHYSLVNAALSWQDAYELKTKGRNHLQMASFSFDVFSGDWTRALCSGGKLVITPREILLDGEKLYELMLKEEVNIAEFVPAVLRNLIDYVEKTNKSLDFFNILIAGSDIWYAGEYKKFKKFTGKETRLINSFGLTEATIDSSYYEAEDLSISDDRLVPIGKPFANMSLYILDKNLYPVPVGVRGELYVGGLGVARGYHNRPEVTAERFIPDPFSKDSHIGERLYRTGDVARFLEDGNIEFLGRADNQIKLRGFRVELGEIESALTELDFVKDAVVIAREDKPGNKRLVAYIVLADASKKDISFKRILSDKLPDYMVPSAYVILEKLPLTPNSKVDRKALPAPEENEMDEITENYVPPRNQIEEFIANIWSDVLGLDTVGVYNNFFDLGGHSLLAAQVISRVKETFKLEIPLRSIFENPTVALLAKVVDKAKAAKSGLMIPPITKVSRQEDLPLSFAQQRLWFLEQLEPDSPFYNIPEIYRVKGNLDAGVLEESINFIIRRHEALRTEFITEKGDPRQVILPELKVKINVTDLSIYEDEKREEAIKEILNSEAKKAINISKAPLFRFNLIKTGEDTYIILFIIHHIISDDWSTSVMFREIALIYESLKKGTAPEIEDLTIQYADYAYWQRGWLKGDVLEAQLNYWKNKLQGTVPLISLPVDHPRPAMQTFNGNYLTFELSKEFSKKIYDLCRNENSTLYMALMAAFQLFLYKYSGQEDFCIGTTIANRNNIDVEKLIGFFVNTLVIRNDANDSITFRELLTKVKETSLEAYTYQDIPFEQVVDAVQPERNLSHSPLFQVMLVIQNAANFKSNIRSSQFEISPVEAHSGTSKFDLTLFMLEDNDHISGAFEYNTDLFEKHTIERMISHFMNLLNEVADNVERKLSEISLLSEDEEKLLITEVNQSSQIPLLNGFAHEAFEFQVRNNPDKTAVISGNNCMKFSELDQKVNKLANYLRNHGIGTEDRAGILLERSEKLIVTLLAILKSGGAYIPIEAGYPDERIKYIIEDSAPKVIITQKRFKDRLEDNRTELLFLDDEDFLNNESADCPEVKVEGDNLAYIIYTSGSTGRPKGVMVTHEGLRNYLSWCMYAYPLDEGSGSIVHSTIAFDATVTSVYPSLLSGKPVMVLSDNGNDVELLGRTLKENKDFSLIKITPAHLEILSTQLKAEELNGITRSFVIGGENLTKKQIEMWQKYSPETLLFNEYGPTETVVGCIVFEASGWMGADGSVPIGKVIPNAEIYVLDKCMNPVPRGVQGELYIGGNGVARGYLNRADITASAFLPDPFSGRMGARLYKTGDLVRVLNDGNLEFLGRIDNQVKLRGFRIELGEIENQIAQYPGIKDAIILIKERSNKDKSLTAYCLKKDSLVPDLAKLKEFLKTRLPEYMIPSEYLFLDEYPLTVNGKVDRKALLLMKNSSTELSYRSYAVPRNETEETLVKIWSEILGKENIGVRDNFFESGGHSLLATRLVAKLRDELNIEIPLKSIFDAPTIEAFGALIEEEKRSAVYKKLPPINKISRKDNLPLSFAQQRLWFLDQLNPGQAIYNMPQALRLKGKLNYELLQESMEKIVLRHEALRTVFVENNGIPVAMILSEMNIKIQFTDFSSLADKENESEVLLQEEARKPFELDKGPLVRAGLIKLEENDHILFITLHHIISDGWSINILIKEAAEIYSALVNGKESKLNDLELQYGDYSYWQQEYLKGDVLDSQLDFWKDVLKNAPKLLELPTDYPRPAQKTFNGSHESFILDDELSRKLYKVSLEENVTPFMILLGAFQVLLSRYSSQSDICVGTPVANRNHSKTESIIGFFANTIVMRLNLEDKPGFREVLRRIRKLTLDALQFQEIPFEKLVDLLNPERDLSYTPLFQVMFVLQNEQQNIKIESLDIIPIESQVKSTQYDITLSMEESSQKWGGTFEYNTDLFKEETILKMIGHFKVILNGLLSDPERPVSDIPMLSRNELSKVLCEWNHASDKPLPEYPDVNELFGIQVKKNPNAIAVSFDGETITYKDLNERSNQLAHYLKERGVGPEIIVGVMANRSIEMIIALISILKAGGAYLPIDPAYPKDRVSYIINDSGVKLILTQNSLKAVMKDLNIALLSIDDIWNEIKGKAISNPDSGISIKNLAYVIYTSGSTGLPKGVMLQHYGLSNLVLSQIRDFEITSDSRLLQFASFSFDASVSEIFTALLSGARLYLAEREKLMSADDLVDLLRSENISVVTLPPTLLNSLPNEKIPDLRTIVSAGERCPAGIGIKWSDGHKFINAYGPTEATVGSSQFVVTSDYIESKYEITGSIPIGKPIDNALLYVLDRQMNAVPVGIPGELYIGGIGLARGYVNKPDVTAERFIPNPFTNISGERLYRTGDLAKYLPDGNIEFIGRVDNQIKLRGFRIELEEIESVLKQYRGVKHAAAVLRENVPGNRVIAAFFSVESDHEISPSELSNYAAKKLPEYMLPSAFIKLDGLPMTQNGKIDKKSLENFEYIEQLVDKNYIKPNTLTEELLASIWMNLFGIEQVGVSNNFFELGGHSLLATQLVSRIKETFDVKIPLSHVFEHPLLFELAKDIDHLKSNEAGPLTDLVPVSRDKILPLSFAQQRLWFLEQYEPDSPLYNLPSVLRIKGKLKKEVFLNGIQKLIQRHEILRTIFTSSEDGEARQTILPEIENAIEIINIEKTVHSGEEFVSEIIMEEIQKPFSLSKGPLFRVKLIELSEEDLIFVLVMHHIISDGWSMSVMISEMSELYQAELNKTEAKLPHLNIQYADYAYWQREWLKGEILEEQVDYWKKQLSGIPSSLSLPLDNPRPPVQTYNGTTDLYELPAEISSLLRKRSTDENVTLFMMLLSIFQVLLSKYSNQSDIVVGTPVANRQSTEVEKLIGFFVNTLALRSKVDENLTFREFLKQVRQTTIDAYTHQDLPFEMLVDLLQVERDLSYTPVFQVMFVMQNIQMKPFKLDAAKIEPVEFENATAKFDLTLTVMDSDEGLSLSFEYNTDLFKQETIKRMAGHFSKAVSEIITDSDIKVKDIDILTDEEKKILLQYSKGIKAPDRNALEANLSDISSGKESRRFETRNIHKVFEAQAVKTPDNIAVKFGKVELSYRELNDKADIISGKLRSLGVKEGDLIGLFLDRKIEMIAAVLGILKCGGAYVPLDPVYPKERLSYILEDINSPVIITSKDLKDKLPICTSKFIYLDDETNDVEKSTDEKVSVEISPLSTAYIIFTSGSTGRPKGVMVTHENVLRLFEATEQHFNFGESDKWTMFHSIAFDFSVWEIYGALFYGGKVIIVPQAISRNPMEYIRLLSEEKVTILNQTPAAFKSLMDAEEAMDAEGTELSDLRYVIFGGDKLDLQSLRPWISRHGDQHPELINMYGITETTVHVTYRRIFEEDTLNNSGSFIGEPLQDLRVFILDRNQKMAPINVPGEICVSGQGLSKGYLNNPDMTSVKFIANPFGLHDGDRLYRSGDLGRFKDNGDIEYLGRIDHQVQIRGFRVELGEIQAALMSHPDVNQAIVLYKEDRLGEKRITAYYVDGKSERTAEGFDVKGKNLSVGELRRHLEKKIPEYMIPSYFVEIDQMPVTEHGKIDRKALPVAGIERPELESSFEEAETETEKTLQIIWKEVLRIEEIGVNDNFFELGGDSILSIQVVAKANQKGIKLTPKQMFLNPTIRALAREAKLSEDLQSEEEVITSEISLSPIQHWFFEHHRMRPEQFNMSMYLELFVKLDIEALNKTIKTLINLHDSLRMNFICENNQWKPVMIDASHPEDPAPNPVNPAHFYDLSEHSHKKQKEIMAEKIRQLQAGFHLNDGYLFKVAYFDLGSKHNPRIIFIFHHLLIDGVSWRIIIDEFLSIYNQYSKNQQITLPAMTSSYRAWTGEIKKYAHSSALKEELNYWLELKGKDYPMLPRDLNGVSTYGSMDNITSSLSAELTSALIKKIPSLLDLQVHDILVAILAKTISKWIKNKNVLLEMEGHGREDVFPNIDLSRTTGWFTSIYPVALEIDGAKTIVEIAQKVKGIISKVPNKGFGFNILKYIADDPEIKSKLEDMPKPQVNFNYLGQFDQLSEGRNIPFRIADEPAGPEQYPDEPTNSLLYVVCIVNGGELHIRWLYSRNVFKTSTVKKLADTFNNELKSLIKMTTRK